PRCGSVLELTQSARRYARASLILRWAVVAVLVVAYAWIELYALYTRGDDPRDALKTWHFMLGLTVFALVWIRMAARLFGKTPPIMPAAPKWQRLVADIVELALYILMFILPLLGWVTLSAEGDPIPFFGLELPALVAPNESLA